MSGSVSKPPSSPGVEPPATSASSPSAPYPRPAALPPSNWQRFREFLNPLYHWHKFREDIAAARHGLSVWHLGQLKSNPAEFERGARGKMFGTFVISGAFACVALPAGIAVQAATKSAWMGMMTPIIVGHLMSNIAFQVIWAWTNRDLYRSERNVFRRFLSLQKDLLPLQWAGIKIVVPMILIALPINIFLAWVIETYFKDLVQYLPVGAFMVVIEMILFQGTYIRLMGNLFERYARDLAVRHCSAAP